MVLVVYAGVATTAEATASRMGRKQTGVSGSRPGGVSTFGVRRISGIVQALFTFAPNR